jgi:hypothetical protein
MGHPTEEESMSYHDYAARKAQIEAKINSFLRRHRATLAEISRSLPSMFEGLCITYVARYYEDELGYQVTPQNLISGRLFRLKYSTRGNPAHYSFFRLERNSRTYEIRHNMSVSGARDPELTYVVDIAVIKADCISKKTTFGITGRKNNYYVCSNEDMRSFAEVKALQAYSMLIAAFVGTVFELEPNALRPSKFEENQRKFAHHMFPSLLVSGPAHIGASLARDSMEDRWYAMVISCDLFNSNADFIGRQNQLHRIIRPSIRSK